MYHFLSGSHDKNDTRRKLTVEEFERDRVVHILPPVLGVGGDGDLPVGPLAGQVDADAGHHLGTVLETEGGEVEAVGTTAGRMDGQTERDMQEKKHTHRGTRAAPLVLEDTTGYNRTHVQQHSTRTQTQLAYKIVILPSANQFCNSLH